MRSQLNVLAIIITLVLSSCVIEKYTQENLLKCSVHNVSLKKVWLQMNYGPPGWPPATCPYSRDAISTLGCEPPKIKPIIRRGQFYVCDSCTMLCKQEPKP